MYPPIGHLGNGPSELAWLSGETVPDDLKNDFVTIIAVLPKVEYNSRQSSSQVGAMQLTELNLVEGICCL